MKVKIFLLLSTIILIVIIWKSNILSIETVKITSLADCINQEALSKEIKSLDKNWILIDSDKFKAKLISKFTCIKDVNIAYEYPKTINITIFGRKFLAKVITTDIPINLPDLESSASSETALLDWNFPTESSEDAFVIDETGFVFAKVKQIDTIPMIFLADNINLGTTLDRQSFKRIDQIFSKISTYEHFSYQLNFKAKKYEDIIIINTTPKLAFSLEKDILKQLASLQLILQKAKIDEDVAEFIDLRFDKPVVLFRTNSSK